MESSRKCAKAESNLNGVNSIPFTCYAKELELMFYLDWKNIPPI